MASPATLNATGGGWLRSNNADYATARATANEVGDTAYCVLGQKTGYALTQSFFSFDTGTELPDNATVTVATFSIYGAWDESTTNFVANVYAYDFGAAVAVGDWRDATQLAALTPLLATWDVAASGWSAARHSFTSTGDMLAAINKTGITYFISASARLVAGTAPTNDESVTGYGYNDATRKPQLYLEYTVPAAGNPVNLFRTHFIPAQIGGR